MKSENNAAQRPAARVPCQVTALITARRPSGTITHPRGAAEASL